MESQVFICLVVSVFIHRGRVWAEPPSEVAISPLIDSFTTRGRKKSELAAATCVSVRAHFCLCGGDYAGRARLIGFGVKFGIAS